MPKNTYILYLALLLAGCAATLPTVREVVMESTPAQEPSWFGQTIQEQGEFVFAVGHSQPRDTEQEAKDDALARATEEFVKYCGVTVEAFSRSIEVSSEVEGKEYYASDFETKRG